MQAGMEYMLREARPGDAVLTIGAGSVGRAGQLAMLLVASRARLRRSRSTRMWRDSNDSHAD